MMFDPFVRIAQSAAPFRSIPATPSTDLILAGLLEEKVAFCDHDTDWLTQFRGTPLFQQAMQLEQASLQNEMAEKKHRQEEEASSDVFSKTRGQIDMQRRMLKLQLVQQEESAGTPTPPVSDAPSPDSLPKMAAAMRFTAALEEMRKVALGVGDLKGIGGAALNFAKGNPRAAAAIGTGALGAGYGALTAKGEGGKSPTLMQRVGRGAAFGAGGAALGGAAATAAPVIKGHLDAGRTLGQATAATAGQGLQGLYGAANRAVGSMPQSVGSVADKALQSVRPHYESAVGRLGELAA